MITPHDKVKILDEFSDYNVGRVKCIDRHNPNYPIVVEVKSGEMYNYSKKELMVIEEQYQYSH